MTVLVIGENCIDRFTEGSVLRVNPEAPYSTVLSPPFKSTDNPGCAANVVSNLKSLRSDWNIEFLTNTEPLLKERFIEKTSGATLVRIDHKDSISSPITFGDFKLRMYYTVKAVVISDYCKGLLSESVLEQIFNYCSERHIPTFIDTRKILGDWSNNVDFVKINESEYKLNKKFNEGMCFHCKNIIVTLGKSGSEWLSKHGYMKISNEEVDVCNPSGAGDTYLAAFVCCYLMDFSPEDCLKYANKAAGIACTKRNVVAVNGEEVWS